MSLPLVSVVVPSYNHARFLRRRIDGLLAQTCQDFEILLLDDASTDGSRALIESYRHDSRLRIFFNEKNSGSPFAQWNRGIALSRGQYVWIAESDDDAEPALLAGLIQLFDGHPEVVVAYCASRLIDENGRPWGRVPDPHRSDGQSRFGASFIRGGREELLAHLTAVCNELPNASSALFRADSLSAIGPADASYGLMGDWHLYARVFLRGSVAFTPETWNGFRCHANSARERHRRSGRRWRELCQFYAWAVRLETWTSLERRTITRRLCQYLVTDMRASRSLVGVSIITRVLLAVLAGHPWIRASLLRTLASQFTARLVSFRKNDPPA